MGVGGASLNPQATLAPNYESGVYYKLFSVVIYHLSIYLVSIYLCVGLVLRKDKRSLFSSRRNTCLQFWAFSC